MITKYSFGFKDPKPKKEDYINKGEGSEYFLKSDFEKALTEWKRKNVRPKKEDYIMSCYDSDEQFNKDMEAYRKAVQEWHHHQHQEIFEGWKMIVHDSGITEFRKEGKTNCSICFFPDSDAICLSIFNETETNSQYDSENGISEPLFRLILKEHEIEP